MKVMPDNASLDPQKFDDQLWSEHRRLKEVADRKAARREAPCRDHRETPADPDPRWAALAGARV